MIFEQNLIIKILLAGAWILSMYLFADTIKSACGLKKTKITKKNASISLVVGIAGISFLLALLGADCFFASDPAHHRNTPRYILCIAPYLLSEQGF